jgi:DNA-binding beta-propeller fold protein YncE
MAKQLRLGVLAAVLAFLPAAARAQPHDLGTYVVFGDTGVKLGGGTGVIEGDIGSNTTVSIGSQSAIPAGSAVAADTLAIKAPNTILADSYFNHLKLGGAVSLGPTHSPISLPVVVMPLPPSSISPSSLDIRFTSPIPSGLGPGSYGTIRIDPGADVVLLGGGNVDCDELLMRSSASALSLLRCAEEGGCTVRVRSRLVLAGSVGGNSNGPIIFDVAAVKPVLVGRKGHTVKATIHAPLATIKLKSSRKAPSVFLGQFVARSILGGSGATLATEGAVCGDGIVEAPEECDPPTDAACPGLCASDCRCVVPGTVAVLHAVGPSALHNATDFGLQIFGENFLPGAQLELSDQTTSAVIATLPTTRISSSEMTALVPAGMTVPSGIERQLVARVINPGAPRSAPPDIGHCQIDRPTSPTACTETADCPANAAPCVNGDQRLSMFNDVAFLNPNSAAVVPAPLGLCDDGTRCQGAGDCTGIGGGACSPKLYVTPQQVDELWVYNTGTAQFVDQNAGQGGIQGIPVGDNPFHVETLTAAGPPRAWVVNRFADSFSIVDPATDTELARVTGAALGVPGRLRMETEIEFNRAGTRAYLSNENTDEVQVLDIAGARRDAPVLLDTIDVGVNPRGMVTNASDTRLYVANIQSADVSVVDIGAGSPTENQVLTTIGTRATDDIVGGRANGWEAFVISGRAPRGIVYSDALDMLFVSSIGPQTGPRQGVVLTGGAIINPTITVIDATTDAVVAHVALNGLDPNRPTCSDPELLALDDVQGRLYVTCQGSGTVDVLDTAALAAGTPAELAMVALPLPTDAVVPTLSLPAAAGTFGAKHCAAYTSMPGAACNTSADCPGCPATVEGLPPQCCAMNNPVGLHNGPRGLALAEDGSRLWVVNQFTTSIATLDVSPANPALIGVTGTRSYPGAFGSNATQQDRRLGQIEFFTDVRHTNVSCATCHIDDHQDGVFFEADVRGPRLRRVLSLRSTRDFSPLLQDQLVPDLMSFTDIVVHAERGGFANCIPCVEINGSQACFGGASACGQTSDLENRQNATYAKAVTFFPNPNLGDDGSFSTTVPLPGGGTGDAVRGAAVFDQLVCQTCHPEPLFTIDQLRPFDPSGLGQPVRMREVSTPVFIPLRTKCQDVNRPTGGDGSAGFSVPTLRGIWDTFPLLMSGSAGLGSAGAEPAFSVGCTPGSAGCCAELASPLNPGGIAVPEQHLTVTTKDALRAVLTAPLAVPGSGHGAALGLSPADLDALIAYIRSL